MKFPTVGQRRLKPFLVSSFTLLVGLAMVWLLARFVSFDWMEFSVSLHNLAPVPCLLLVASSCLHFAITAHKWRIATREFAPTASLRAGFLFYSALIGLLGQLMPLQVANLLVRSLALRFHRNVPVHTGATSVLYDQFFDLFIPFVLLIPVTLKLAGIFSITQVFALSMASLALLTAVTAFAGRRMMRMLFWIIGSIPGFKRFKSQASKRLPLLRREIILKLMFWSALRYGNLVLRAWLITLAARLELPFLSILYANCFVTLSFLLSVTPGGLGIVEWGWTGGLVALGVEPGLAAQFAVLSRLLIVASVIAANLAFLPGLAFVILAASQRVALKKDSNGSAGKS